MTDELEKLREQLPADTWQGITLAWESHKKHPYTLVAYGIWDDDLEAARVKFFKIKAEKAIKDMKQSEAVAKKLHANKINSALLQRALHPRYIEKDDKYELDHDAMNELRELLIDESRNGFSSMGESFVRYLSVELLRLYAVVRKPVDINICDLFEELFGTASFGLKDSRTPYKRILAILYMAKSSNAGIRETARAIGIDARTVHAWVHQDEHFKYMVESLRENPEPLRVMSELYKDDLPTP